MLHHIIEKRVSWNVVARLYINSKLKVVGMIVEKEYLYM